MEKFFLIDGNHLIHRSFHAIKPLYTRSGEQTNAIFGFFSILLNLIEKENPQYLAVTFDEKAPTFRHIEHTEYKATRTKAPDELYTQIPKIKEILKAFNIPYYGLPGYEADDLLGTFSHQIIQKDLKAFIITGDHDALQLVDDDKILVIFPHKGYREPILFNEAKVIEKLGVRPNQIPDYKGLCGDASDNLKGVQGIGPKGAQKLLEKYQSIENIYNHLTEIGENERNKLIQGEASAHQCKKLATILIDAPLEIQIDNCVLKDFDLEKISDAFSKYELFTLQRRLKNIFHKQTSTIPKKTDSVEQMQLF